MVVASVVLSRGWTRRIARPGPLGTACLLLATGGPAHAAEPAAQATTAEAPSDAAAEAEAQRLFEEGSQAYNLGNFEAAIERFEAAYNLSHASALLYNIGQAYSKRYEVDPDPAFLRKARVLYLNFAKINEAAGEDARDARDRVAAIDARLAELAAAEPEPKPEGPAPGPAPEPAPTGPYRPGKAGIAGFALIGSGLVLGSGLAALGFVSAGRLEGQRREESEFVPLSAERASLYDERTGSARALAFAGIGAGSALLLTGVVLVAVDAARGGAAPRRAQLRPGGLMVAF